jgi:hypothetical protein
MLVFASCEKIEEPVVAFGKTENIVVNGSGGYLSSVIYEGIDVPLKSYYDDTQVKLKSARMTEDNFFLESSVTSPTIDGELLSASYVQILKINSVMRAYVTYNLSGAAHGGALVVLDLTNPEDPKITSEIIFKDIDLNVCEVYHGGKMLWVGGSSFKKGAVIIPLELDGNGDVITGPDNQVDFDILTIKNVASVNGIKEAGDWIMVTAGNAGGGTFALNFKKGYRDDGTHYFPNAKYSSTNGHAIGKYHVSLQAGEEAALHVYRIGVKDEDEAMQIPLGSIYHNVQNEADKYSGKATCFMEKNSRFCYISMGANGFVAVDIFDKNKVMQSSPNLLKHGNTNAISVDENYIYLANGADGLVICKKPDVEYGREAVVVEPLYSWDEETENASANFVNVLDEYIFVAKGASGGLKIVKRKF